MKELISDNTKFEQINIEEDKQLNFHLKSEKEVIDLKKRLETECKISEKEYLPICSRGSRPGILNGSQKPINQLLITATNSVLFCQRLEHLLTNTDKLMVSQWVLYWVRLSRMHFYVIFKNSGCHNVPLIFYLKYSKDVLMIFL